MYKRKVLSIDSVKMSIEIASRVNTVCMLEKDETIYKRLFLINRIPKG